MSQAVLLVDFFFRMKISNVELTVRLEDDGRHDAGD
jgi:hypothetical protein